MPEQDKLEEWLTSFLAELAPHASYDSEDREHYEHFDKLLEDHRYRRIYSERLQREGEVIRAMQYRFAHRHPIRHFFWRKPWRSTAPIGWSDGKTLTVKVANLVSWLRFAHDCTDPAVGCSCHPSYRFPDPEKK